jgi:hypothetical protein
MAGPGAIMVVVLLHAPVYLIAFALFAGVALFAKWSWRISGAIGVVIAVAYLTLNDIRSGTFDERGSLRLFTALAVLTLVLLTNLWPRRS